MKFKNLMLPMVLICFNSLVIAAEEEKTPQKKNNQQLDAKSLGDKLPPYNNPNRFVFEASFIYWQASEDGLDYGLADNGQRFYAPDVPSIFDASFVDNPTPTYDLSGKLKDKEMDFKWDPGFKAGIGFIFGERDQWDLFLNWTWLHSNANGSYKGPQSISKDLNAPELIINPTPLAQQYLIPSWGPVALGGPSSSAKSNWKLQYNTVDLELGRNFFLAKNITLRPHIGLRGAFIHQHVKVNYDSFYNVLFGMINNVPLLSNEMHAFSLNNHFKAKNNYDAAGLRGGLDANWNFTNCFAVYGKISTSILYGRFKVDEDFTSDNVFGISLMNNPLANFDITDKYDFSLDDNYHRVRSTIQVALGFTWHTDFNNDKQHLYVSLGYEFNEWFQQNELRELILPPAPSPVLLADPIVNPENFPFAVNAFNLSIDNMLGTLSNETKTNRREGDLGLQGLTFDVRFDF